MKSYAKVNIGLIVKDKRQDGYHDIETIFHLVNLFDEIDFMIEENGKNGIVIERNVDYLESGVCDLMEKAYRAFIAETGLCFSLHIKIVKNMGVHKSATDRLMNSYGIFSATERLLMEAVKRGGDRQALHEVIRDESIRCWQDVQEGRENPLRKRLSENKEILSFLTKEEILSYLDASSYIGEAVRFTDKVLSRYHQAK